MNHLTLFCTDSPRKDGKILPQSLPVPAEHDSVTSQLDQALKHPKTFKKMMETNPFFKAQVQAQIEDEKQR